MPPSFSHGFLLLTGFCCLLPSTQAEDPQDATHNIYDAEHNRCRRITYTISNTSVSLFRELAQRSKHKNILFSPIRVAAAFAMLSLGAKGNTKQEIMEGLRLNVTGLTEDEIHKCFQHLLRSYYETQLKSPLFSGNSLFVHQDLSMANEFVKKAKELYQYETIPVNFTNSQEAKKQINNHMKQKTHKEIATVVKDLEQNMSVVIANYLIFHARWYDTLNCQHVVRRQFHLDKRRTITVPMVSRSDILDLVWMEQLSSMVLIASNLGTTTTIFILPDEGKMEHVEQILTNPRIRAFFSPFRSTRLITIRMPKVSVSETHDLESLMRMRGITQIFSDHADLSGATAGAPLKLSKLIHKAVLTMDAKGTAGSPKDTLCSSGSWGGGEHIEFKRPFLVFVMDQDHRTPLLIGRIMDPRA